MLKQTIDNSIQKENIFRFFRCINDYGFALKNPIALRKCSKSDEN